MLAAMMSMVMCMEAAGEQIPCERHHPSKTKMQLQIVLIKFVFPCGMRSCFAQTIPDSRPKRRRAIPCFRSLYLPRCHIAMTRGLKLASGVALGVVALFALVLALLSLVNWNALSPWIGARVSEAAGRTFAIRGDLDMWWQRPQDALPGWRAWLPWPHLRARDVTLGNPSWATTGPIMASVKQVDLCINPVALLIRTIRVSSLVLTEPQLVLERAKDGANSVNNWTFPRKDDKHSGWRVALDDLIIKLGNVRLVDPTQRADVRVRIDTLSTQEAGRARGGSVRWRIDGVFNRDKVSGEGMAGALLALESHDVKYPLKARLKMGEAEI